VESTERQARRAAYAIAPGVLLAGIAGGIAFPILPLVGVRAGLPMWLIGAILAANRAGRVITSPVVGVLTDRMGGRRILVIGLSLQIVVMALYWLGVARGSPGAMFLCARLLHGPASACVFVGAQTLALHAGGKVHGGVAATTVRASMSAGMPVGLAVGGLVAGWAGDATTFAAALVVVASGALVAWLTVPDLRWQGDRQKAAKGAWRMLADRRLLSLGALNFAMFFSAQGVVLATIVLVVHQRALRIAGLGAQGTAGLAMAWMVVIATVVMALAGRLGDRRGLHARIAASGIVLSVPGLLMVGLAHSGAWMAFGMALVGSGMGALGPSLLALLAVLVEPEHRGRATGALQLCGDLGGVLGPIAGTMLTAQGAATPYLISAAILTLVLPVGLWLAWRERRYGIAARAVAPPDQTAILD
jgi:MFS family permease